MDYQSREIVHAKSKKLQEFLLEHLVDPDESVSTTFLFCHSLASSRYTTYFLNEVTLEASVVLVDLLFIRHEDEELATRAVAIYCGEVCQTVHQDKKKAATTLAVIA
jgi:hypothetical protein